MSIVDGPWPDWDSPTPREQENEARHADALDFVISKVEADPDDVRALKDISWFACRSRYKSIREKALEALRVAGDRHAE